MDPWTAALLMLVTCAECSLLFFASGLRRHPRTARDFPAPFFWGLGTALYVFGLFALLLQARTPPWLGIVASNAGIMLGFMLIIVGIRKLLGRSLYLSRYAGIWIAYVCAVALLTYRFPSTTARIIAFSCIIASLYLEGALLLAADHRRTPNPFSPMIAATFALLAVFFLARGTLVIAAPQSSVFTASALNAATFLVSHIGLIAWSLGLILLQNLRMAQDLERAYQEKETLFRELQHRVKNSMAVISGLVSLESTRLKAADSVAILESLKARIDAIAALYDRLYRSGDTEEVELDAYFRDLADTLWAGTAAAKKGVALRLDLDTVRLDAKRAVSLGIIANELLSDSLKYAFPDGRSGTVRLSLKRNDDRLLLEVADDGVGLPAGFAVGSTAGLGLVLVDMLAAQVDGEFTAESERGARFLVRVPVSTRNPR